MNRKAFLKQLIAVEKQSLAAHQRELELIENANPEPKQDKKNERVKNMNSELLQEQQINHKGLRNLIILIVVIILSIVLCS